MQAKRGMFCLIFGRLLPRNKCMCIVRAHVDAKRIGLNSWAHGVSSNQAVGSTSAGACLRSHACLFKVVVCHLKH